MDENKGNYRDALAAAHARIADLEEQLEAQRRPAAELSDTWVATLIAERDQLIAETKRPVPWTTWVAYTIAPAALITLGATLGAVYLGLQNRLETAAIAALSILWPTIVSYRRLKNREQISLAAARPKLDAIEGRIRDARRTAEMVAGAGRVAEERLRIAQDLPDDGAGLPGRVAPTSNTEPEEVEATEALSARKQVR